MNRENKIKLLNLLFSGIITKNEFNLISKYDVSKHFLLLEASTQQDYKKHLQINQICKRFGIDFAIFTGVNVSGMTPVEIQQLKTWNS